MDQDRKKDAEPEQAAPKKDVEPKDPKLPSDGQVIAEKGDAVGGPA